MSFVMPVGMTYDGSNSVDSVTFVHADHTATLPHFTIVDRKAPVTKGNVTSFASYRMRTFRGVADPVTGVVKKSVVESEVRFPAYADLNNVNLDVAFHGTILADTNFQAGIEAFLLPRGVAAA